MKQYYHGENERGPYFEGWYFKLRARDGTSLALIPAVHIREDGEKSASIQVIGEEGAWWAAFPGDDFRAREDAFCIQVGENSFSETGLQVDIQQDGLKIQGTISFGPFHGLKWDIMGPFQWLKGMECVHSVISMKHPVHGWIRLNGKILDFRGGTGYLESDRGRSFPERYLWNQCTWQGGSMMLSVARVPLGKHTFTGCICALLHAGREHRIATYLGARVQNWSEQGAVIRQGRYRLQVQLLEQRTQPLRAPEDGHMIRTVHESLRAKVRVRLWQGGQLLMDRTDDHAGFEFSDG